MDGQRRFGIAAHLYSLRSPGDQGIGDFSTLRRFAASSAATGAALLGLNPLHALFPHDRSRASPYHPSDRRFLDPIYIDVSGMPGGGAAPRVPGPVDYRTVWAHKHVRAAGCVRCGAAGPGAGAGGAAPSGDSRNDQRHAWNLRLAGLACGAASSRRPRRHRLRGRARRYRPLPCLSCSTWRTSSSPAPPHGCRGRPGARLLPRPRGRRRAGWGRSVVEPGHADARASRSARRPTRSRPPGRSGACRRPTRWPCAARGMPASPNCWMPTCATPGRCGSTTSWACSACSSSRTAPPPRLAPM